MRVVEIRGSFGIENLVETERPEPVPGPGEVAVKVSAASLNFRDLLMVRGHYNPRQPLPLIPLSDGVGEVIGVGRNVRRVQIGDRVAGCFVQDFVVRPGPRDGSHLRRTLGGPIDGMLAEVAVLSAHGVVKVPEHLSDVDAATLPCAGVTAWSALVGQGGMQAGDVVVVQGTGGVSLFALQIAQALGAFVIVTSSSDAKLERALAMGAHEGINYVKTPEWGKEVKRLTDRLGADHIVEVGGGGTLQQSIKAVRRGGHISVIGVLSGGRAEVNVTPILMGNIRLQGVFVGSRTEFQDLNEAVTRHKIEPIVDRVFPFSEAREAFEYFAEGNHFGKVCISFD